MQSNQVFDKASKSYQPADNSFLEYIVKIINLYVCHSTIQMNTLAPDYFLLNEILIRASRSNNIHFTFVTEAYSDMLVDSINKEYELDQHQVRMAERELPRIQYRRILDPLSKPI